MYYLYILRCSDNSLYTGITNDLEHRLKVHLSGKGSKYVRAHLPFTFVYSESFDTKEIAMKREYEVKQWSREKKMREFSLSD